MCMLEHQTGGAEEWGNSIGITGGQEACQTPLFFFLD